MQEEYTSLVDNATDFEKSLKELRNFSSQLYHAADYCEAAFLNAKNKKKVVENTKEYVSKAVVTFVDHLGSTSASLEYCISENDYVPQTEEKINTLQLRIMTWQEYPHKLALHRFYCTSTTFPRYHCRYMSPPLMNSVTMNPGVSRVVEIGVNVKTEKENKLETEEPLFLYTYNCKPSIAENSTRSMEKKKNGFSHPVLPVSNGLSILPKAGLSNFQFQEAQKLKRSILNWKLMQNKEITSLIRRGKRMST